MIITPRPDVTIGDLFPTDQPPRTEGVHLSEILRSIMVDLEPEVYDPSKPMDMLRVMAGMAFERALERSFAAMHQTRFPSIVRPGEFTRDGIIGTPDGLECASDPPRVYEYKGTWKSSRQPYTDKKFLIWLMQIKGYLKMMGLRHATLIAFHVNGAYERGLVGGGQPVLNAVDLEFSRQEIEENWLLILSHGRRKGLLR